MKCDDELPKKLGTPLYHFIYLGTIASIRRTMDAQQGFFFNIISNVLANLGKSAE